MGESVEEQTELMKTQEENLTLKKSLLEVQLAYLGLQRELNYLQTEKIQMQVEALGCP